jgi:hypothetical protein
VKYEGRAKIGDDDQVTEVFVRVPDVEHPDWFALITDGGAKLARGEVSVNLLDGGIYNAWQGTGVVRKGPDGLWRLMGHAPLTPPVGA